MVCTVLSLASCVKDKNTVESSPICAITSFSVGNITSNVTTTSADGTSTTTKRVYSGSSVFFSIDQQAGTITNVDALPNWITLGKVMPKFSSYGNVYLVIDSVYYGITSGSDSIDVSVPRKLACISTDGSYVKYYTLTITTKEAGTDTIVWERLSDADLRLSGSHRMQTVAATYRDRQNTDSLVRRMMVFSADAAGHPQVTSSTDGVTWTAPAPLTGSEGVIDWNSVMLHQGKLYAIDNIGKLYTSTEAARGEAWTKVADTQLKRLLGSDGTYVYAYDGTAIVATQDFIQWTVQGQENLDMLPEHSFYSFWYTANTNSKLTSAMMGGLSERNTQHGVTWYKVTSEIEQCNQPWSYIQVSGDNEHGCPRLKELCTVYYEGNLYTMGRRTQSDGSYKFEGFYRSEDNGIAWYLQSKKWRLPKDLDAANGPASVAVVGNTAYVVQDGGLVWRGAIQ